MQDQEKPTSSALYPFERYKELKPISDTYQNMMMHRLSELSEKELIDLPTQIVTKEEKDTFDKFGCVFIVGRQPHRIYALGGSPFKVHVNS